MNVFQIENCRTDRSFPSYCSNPHYHLRWFSKGISTNSWYFDSRVVGLLFEDDFCFFFWYDHKIPTFGVITNSNNQIWKVHTFFNTSNLRTCQVLVKHRQSPPGTVLIKWANSIKCPSLPVLMHQMWPACTWHSSVSDNAFHLGHRVCICSHSLRTALRSFILGSPYFTMTDVCSRFETYLPDGCLYAECGWVC